MGEPAIQTVTLTLYRFESLATRLWAFAMMGLARPQMSRIDGLNFWKLCGSGTGEGFTPKPNTRVYGMLCVWPDEDVAREVLQNEPIFGRYRSRATEAWTVFLAPVSTWGAWSGVAPFHVQEPGYQGPLAALTRATLRPGALMR
ncbi:MAG: spheroidene monooxygenase, partial [Pseudomonadota bacterium]